MEKAMKRSDSRRAKSLRIRSLPVSHQCEEANAVEHLSGLAGTVSSLPKLPGVRLSWCKPTAALGEKRPSKGRDGHMARLASFSCRKPLCFKNPLVFSVFKLNNTNKSLGVFVSNIPWKPPFFNGPCPPPFHPFTTRPVIVRPVSPGRKL